MSEKWSQSGNGERPPAYACVPRVLEIPGISPFVMNVPEGIADLDRRYGANDPVPPPELVCCKRLADGVGLEGATTDVLDETVFAVAHEDSERRITITLGMTGVHNGIKLSGGMEAKGYLEPDGTGAYEDWQYLLHLRRRKLRFTLSGQILGEKPERKWWQLADELSCVVRRGDVIAVHPDGTQLDLDRSSRAYLSRILLSTTPAPLNSVI